MGNRMIGVPVKSIVLMVVMAGQAAGFAPEALLTPGRAFEVDERFVSTTVFHWYKADVGQRQGTWPPLGGRESWDGSVAFWKRQIKDVMDANIDLMYIHMNPRLHETRIKLFRAAAELRQEGYRTPRIAPFLDPEVTWSLRPSPIDLATKAGKDEWVGEFVLFFQQYFSVTKDKFAADHLGRIGDRLILNTWHNVPGRIDGLNALTRADVESRLKAAFGERYPIFRHRFYVVGTGLWDITYPRFADARKAQFERQPYFQKVTHRGFTIATVQPGYWDQNVRTPGRFLPRAGGKHYRIAWEQALADKTIGRVYVESFNEYDEGSGIYAGETGPPRREGQNPNDDVWSASDNPREYIDTTAAGARRFNATPDHAASILWHDLPREMRAGARATATVFVRNEGDFAWTGADEVKLGQQEFLNGEVVFGTGRYLIDDKRDEIPVYGGIFRGRPIAFKVELTAPPKPGRYVTHWAMVHEHVRWFGPVLEHTITVAPAE